MRESAVHVSLQRKQTIIGVDARVFGLEAGLLAIIISLKMWWYFALLPVVHLLARWAQSRDEHMVEAAVRYSREVDRWDPWHHVSVVEQRPTGFGKGIPR